MGDRSGGPEVDNDGGFWDRDGGVVATYEDDDGNLRDNTGVAASHDSLPLTPFPLTGFPLLVSASFMIL